MASKPKASLLARWIVWKLLRGETDEIVCSHFPLRISVKYKEEGVKIFSEDAVGPFCEALGYFYVLCQQGTRKLVKIYEAEEVKFFGTMWHDEAGFGLSFEEHV